MNNMNTPDQLLKNLFPDTSTVTGSTNQPESIETNNDLRKDNISKNTSTFDDIYKLENIRNYSKKLTDEHGSIVNPNVSARYPGYINYAM